MSDFFKKIRSIEVEDDAIIDVIKDAKDDGVNHQLSDDSETSVSKPLNLSSVEDDDDILELVDLDQVESGLIENQDIVVPIEPRKKASTPLGLTPLLAAGLTAPKSKPSKLNLKPVSHDDELSLRHEREKFKPTNAVQPPPAPPASPPTPPATQTVKAAPETSAAPKKPAGSLFAPRQTHMPEFLETETAAQPEEIAPKPNTAAKTASTKYENIAPDVTAAATASAPATLAFDNESSSARRGIITLSVLAALIWTVSAIYYGTRKGSTGLENASAIDILSLCGLVLFPVLLIALLSYAACQLTKLSGQSEGLRAAAQAMLTPDDSVIARSTIMAKSIQAQVDDVNLKVSSALNRMELLDDMVKSQGSSLSRSALAIETTTNDIEGRISAQREGLENVADLFEGRMTTLSSMLEGHTAQLSSSGQMAEQRVQEARVSVESAAEKITTASETVRQNAVVAAQTLSGSHVEITQLGASVQEQSTRLDATYRQHLNDLRTMLTELRGQQDELAATMEERLSKMRDMSLSAKVGAESLTEASVKGRETVEALNEAAALTDTAVRARFSEMEEMVKYSTARAESISETAARQVQLSLSSTRKEISRIEADMMDLMDKMKNAESSSNASAKTDFSALQNPPPELRGPAEITNSLPPPSAEPPEMPSPEMPSMELRDINQAETTKETEVPMPSLFTVAPHQNSDDVTLDLHSPEPEDVPKPLRRTLDEQKTAKSKNRWNWRGIFPISDTSPPSSAAFVDANMSNHDIIKNLSSLGLTPGAIVDDGCIIEAVNLRISNGNAAMSNAVAKRLSTPVRYLFRALEKDPQLKLNIRAYTERFNAQLTSIGTDREAIRQRLESDEGRAYLLCDASLNA